MARLVYADGGVSRGGRFGFRRGWWAIDYPEAEIHFYQGVSRLTNIEMADDSHHLQLLDEELNDHPWLFVQQIGQGRWIPSAEEAHRLREYLLKGGFLVVDDFHGEADWSVVAQVFSRVLPEYPIRTLQADSDEIFHALYDLDTLTQIPGERHLYRNADGRIEAQLQGAQRWSGIYDSEGRLMVIMNFNMDMGDAWEHADDPWYPEPMTALAYRFGINYLVYALTH